MSPIPAYRVVMKFTLLLWSALLAIAPAGALEFDGLLKEINAAADATTVTAEFGFTNQSSKPVTISKTDPGCSCLTVEVANGKLQYAPGESGTVRATFDMGNLAGTVDKMVALWIDDDPLEKPSVQLNIRVHIPVLVELEPKTVKWEIGGTAQSQAIHIHMAGDQPIHVTQVTPSSDAFSCELKTLENGRKYDLIVTPKVPDAPALAIIRVENDCAIAKHRTQQAFAVMRKAPTPQTPPKP
ncbi:MAG: DUF1573 domain-containing protein [Akkermansiaceae bacterium]|nr:DUF1573 domain-containing protein [Akkermansiaceae bacterium]